MKRSEIDLKIDVLRKCRSPTIKTHIIYGCNLNFVVARSILNSLMTTGCIEKQGKKFITSPKGRDAITQFDSVRGLIGGI